ncbi:MAG: hypothetical protein ACREF9_15945 [Opitutaceae bacterium]
MLITASAACGLGALAFSNVSFRRVRVPVRTGCVEDSGPVGEAQ